MDGDAPTGRSAAACPPVRGSDGCRGFISGADTPLPPHLRREVVELLAAALVADYLRST
jgi:hypothetical protein